MKKFNYWLILIIVTYGFIELSSFAGLYFLSKFRKTKYEPADQISNKHAGHLDKFIKEKTTYLTYSPVLGWSIKKNGSSEYYQANSSGIRSNKEYSLTPPLGRRRVSTFGDSFVHGNEVKNNETWQAIMEGYDSKIEVINFGVAGFGLDQAYLRYLEDGRQYQSHIVLIGFLSENIYRNVNTYRAFYWRTTKAPLTKPRFIMKDGKLSLIPNPMKKLEDYKKLLLYPQKVLSYVGTYDYYYPRRYKSDMFDWSPTNRLMKILAPKVSRKSPKEGITINGRYNENSEAFIVTKKIFDEFYNKVITDKSLPIIVIFPLRSDIHSYKRKKETRYSPLLSYFDARGYKYIDLMDALKNADVKETFLVGHYSPYGNMLVATQVFNYLNNMSSQEN